MTAIERLRELEKKIRREAMAPMDADGCSAIECADELSTLIAELGQEVGAVADSELPGMWSASDFTGGDPDERCYSDRDLFASNLRSALGKHYDPEAGIVCSVALLAADKNTSPAHTSEARENDPTWRLFDRVDFALRDAGFDLDLASAIAARADDFFGDEYDAAMRQEGRNG